MNKVSKGKGCLKLLLAVLLLCPVQSLFAGGNIQPGIELFNKAEYQKAYEYFDAIESGSENEKNPEFQYYYGLSLYKTDQAKEAVKAMKSALTLEPENAEYQFAMTMVYLLRMGEVSVFRKPGLFGALKKTMKAAADHEPMHLAAMRFYTGWLLYAPGIGGGDVDEGMVYLEKLKEFSEADGFLFEAGLANRGEDYARAEELYLKAIELKSSPSIHMGVARYYLEQEKYEQAISYANTFNLLPKRWSDRGNSEGHLILAGSYHYLGDAAAFEEHSKMAFNLAGNKATRERVEKFLDDLE